MCYFVISFKQNKYTTLTLFWNKNYSLYNALKYYIVELTPANEIQHM